MKQRGAVTEGAERLELRLPAPQSQVSTGTLFLDKSAFEALSRQYAPMLQFVFLQGLVPTLIYEVLADLDGEAAGFVDISAFNRAIVRWSHGHFDSDDLNLALAWRSTTCGLGLTEFCAHLGRLRIPFPRPRQDLSDPLPITDGVIGDRDRQGAWVQYLLEHLQVAPRIDRL